MSHIAHKLGILTVSLVCLPSMASSTAHGITDGTQLSDTVKSLSNQSLKSNPYGLNDAQIQAIASSVAWRRLLLFKDFPTGKDESRLDNPKFFVATTGHNDAKAELVATLDALARQNQAVLCQFPARAHFLANQLGQMGVPHTIDLTACSEFQAFAKSLDAKRLSLIFAEEHPNALASAFAHVLLKADNGSDDDKRAMAVNYTVASDAKDSAVKSTLKSISGKYAGVMEILPYQDKQNDYLVKDERDLWQYTLNLSEAEVAQIVRHIWEVKDMARPYFFTHDNCATEIVRLIDVVRPDGHLKDKVGKIVIPSRIASILVAQGVVAQTQFIPSASTLRQARLNASHQSAGAVDATDTLLPSRNNPANATPVHRIGLGVGMDERYADKAVYGLALNGAYQDLLDNPNGVRPLLDLQLMSLDAIVDDEKVKIKDLTIFSTRSLNPANTAKNNATDPIGVGKAWGQRLKFSQVIDASTHDNDDHLVLDVGLQKGKAWNLGQARAHTGEIADTTCYVLADGGVQIGQVNQGYRVGIGAVAGCVHYATERVRGLVELSVPYYYHADGADGVRSGYFQPSVSVGAQADISRDYAVRLVSKTERLYDSTNTQAMLYLSKYF